MHSLSFSWGEPCNLTQISPAADHEFIDCSWTPSRRGKTNSFVDQLNTILVCVLFKWFVSETPYLIHDTTKAPHITGSGVLFVEDGLYKNYIIALICLQNTNIPLGQSTSLEFFLHERRSSWYQQGHVTSQSQQSVGRKRC